MTKERIHTILFVAVAVLLTLQITSMFRKTPVNERDIRNKIELEYLKKDLPIIKNELVVVREKYDSLLSLSVKRYEVLETKKQPIQNAIKNNRSVIADFDKEQLRRAITNPE